MDTSNHATRDQLARFTQRTPAKVHRSGSMLCLGRCGARVSANRKPPLCRACKLLFDAQVLVDQARYWLEHDTKLQAEADAARAEGRDLGAIVAGGPVIGPAETPTHPEGAVKPNRGEAARNPALGKN
jgi:hypothetical protein